jgi:Tol biopolymer transport system component
VDNPSLSPDGTRLALERVEPGALRADIWIVDLPRGTSSRLTFEPQDEGPPVWSPDGKYVYYNAEREERRGVYRKPASGAGGEELVVEAREGLWMRGLTRDGRLLVGITGSVARDISLMPLAAGGAPRLFMQTPFDEGSAEVSPDGRWIAYDSDESGRPEVYVQSFPEPGGKWQVSTSGGRKPRWRQDGRELYFLAPDRMLMAAAVKAEGSGFEAGLPEPLFPTELPVVVGGYPYAAAADGRRFVVSRPESEGVPAPFNVVLSWDAALKE